MADLKPFHVQEWVDSYPDFSQTFCRNYFRSIKRCVSWACKQGYIDRDPVKGLEVPAGEHREVCIAKPEFEQMLSFIPEQCFRDLWEVTFQTGCRPQESLRVEARHVDIARSRWVFPIKESKGKKQPRIVYLSPQAEEVTKRLTKQHPDGGLFRNSCGRPWTTEAVNCAFDRLQHRMGRKAMHDQGVDLLTAIQQKMRELNDLRNVMQIPEKERYKLSYRVFAKFAPRYSLYALRHSWATAALQSGLDGLTVGLLLGHNDPSTLARVYRHLSHNPEHLLKQMRSTVRD